MAPFGASVHLRVGAAGNMRVFVGTMYGVLFAESPGGFSSVFSQLTQDNAFDGAAFANLPIAVAGTPDQRAVVAVTKNKQVVQSHRTSNGKWTAWKVLADGATGAPVGGARGSPAALHPM
jgi:hypothetical protein